MIHIYAPNTYAVCPVYYSMEDYTDEPRILPGMVVRGTVSSMSEGDVLIEFELRANEDASYRDGICEIRFNAHRSWGKYSKSTPKPFTYTPPKYNNLSYVLLELCEWTKRTLRESGNPSYTMRADADMAVSTVIHKNVDILCIEIDSIAFTDDSRVDQSMRDQIMSSMRTWFLMNNRVMRAVRKSVGIEGSAAFRSPKGRKSLGGSVLYSDKMCIYRMTVNPNGRDMEYEIFIYKNARVLPFYGTVGCDATFGDIFIDVQRRCGVTFPYIDVDQVKDTGIDDDFHTPNHITRIDI